MVIGIIGESCTGKSTLAEKLKEQIAGAVFTGKDYLRLAKDESAAKELFRQKLLEAMTGGNIIYIIAEKEQLQFLPAEAIRVLMTADLNTIKKRFSERMHGILPSPVALALERKHGCFDAEKHDIHIVSGEMDLEEACRKIVKLVGTEPAIMDVEY